MENYVDYKNMLKNIKNNNLSIVKLDIASDLESFHDKEYDNLFDDEKMMIVNLIYSYWLKNDLIENTLYNVIEVAIKFVEDIKQNEFSYKYFEKIIDYNI